MQRLRNRNHRVTEPVRVPEPAGRLSSGLLLLTPLAFIVLVIASALLDRSLSPLSWYLARATGIMLYLLFWGSVMAGLLLTTRIAGRAINRSSLLSLHAYFNHLAYAFLAGHLFSLIVDPYVRFSVIELVAPFKAPTVEPWTGFGVIAMYLFFVVVATASFRRYIPYRVWRFLHVLAFPMYALSLVHSIKAGSDSGSTVMIALYATTAALVFALSLWRALGLGGPIPMLPESAGRRPLDRLGGQTILPRTTGDHRP